MKKKFLVLMIVLSLFLNLTLCFASNEMLSSQVGNDSIKNDSAQYLFNSTSSEPPIKPISDIKKVKLKDLKLSINKDTKNKTEFNINTSLLPLTTLERAEGDNQKPIADLRYAILNPDSLINGQITTNTQIAWLWSYGGVDFMYDPDGDQITNIQIDGIPSESVLGYLTGDIGFVTQFSTPAQYIMRFKCMDEHGLWSDEWSISIPVEPVDNNSRPNCVINYSTLTGDTNTQFIWGWFNSYDPDVNDYISGIEGTVLKDGEYYSIDDYIVNQDSDGCATVFSEPGNYTLMFRVSDNHNAWSNWVSINITVNDAIPTIISDVVIESHVDDDYQYYYSSLPYYRLHGVNYAPTLGLWVDEKIAYDAYMSGSTISYLSDFNPYRSLGTLDIDPRSYDPENLLKIFAVDVPQRKIVYKGFEIRGTTNKPNTTIAVAFALGGQLISETVQTDASGNFSVDFAESRIPTYIDTKYAWYSNLCTNYIDPTDVMIIAPGNTMTIPIYVITGYLGDYVALKNWVKTSLGWMPLY